MDEHVKIAVGLTQWLRWKQTRWPLPEKVLRDCLPDSRGDLVSCECFCGAIQKQQHGERVCI